LPGNIDASNMLVFTTQGTCQCVASAVANVSTRMLEISNAYCYGYGQCHTVRLNKANLTSNIQSDKKQTWQILKTI